MFCDNSQLETQGWSPLKTTSCKRPISSIQFHKEVDKDYCNHWGLEIGEYRASSTLKGHWKFCSALLWWVDLERWASRVFSNLLEAVPVTDPMAKSMNHATSVILRIILSQPPQLRSFESDLQFRAHQFSLSKWKIQGRENTVWRDKRSEWSIGFWRRCWWKNRKMLPANWNSSNMEGLQMALAAKSLQHETCNEWETAGRSLILTVVLELFKLEIHSVVTTKLQECGQNFSRMFQAFKLHIWGTKCFWNEQWTSNVDMKGAQTDTCGKVAVKENFKKIKGSKRNSIWLAVLQKINSNPTSNCTKRLHYLSVCNRMAMLEGFNKLNSAVSSCIQYKHLSVMIWSQLIELLSYRWSLECKLKLERALE